MLYYSIQVFTIALTCVMVFDHIIVVFAIKMKKAHFISLSSEAFTCN